MVPVIMSRIVLNSRLFSYPSACCWHTATSIKVVVVWAIIEQLVSFATGTQGHEKTKQFIF